MDQLGAAKETMRRMEERASEPRRLDSLPEELQMPHLRSMMRRMEENSNSFSDAKMGRWLGWMQAAGTATGLLSLEEAKEINMEFAD